MTARFQWFMGTWLYSALVLDRDYLILDDRPCEVDMRVHLFLFIGTKGGWYGLALTHTWNPVLIPKHRLSFITPFSDRAVLHLIHDSIP